MFNWESFFEEWKKKYNISVFMKDGIVCEKKYENILFILKDVNKAKPDNDNDLCEYVKTGYDGGKTWFNIVRWIQALLDGIAYEQHLEDVKNKYDNDFHKFQHEQIKRAAIINLKKEAGGRSVPNHVVNTCAKEQKEEILQEIEQCQPNVIIVCGVGIFSGAKEVLGEVTSINKKKTVFEMASDWELGTVKVNGNDVPIIQFRHPSVGCDAEKSYNDMLKIRELILK